MTEIKGLQEQINAAIPDLQLDGEPQNLYDPIRYILSLGGKRMRPLLVLLGYGVIKDDPLTILRPALAVEVFHNFTLMHDDIMDAAPKRRGNPTVHEKWNNNVAILSGDAMLVRAYDLLLEMNSQILPQVIRRFNQTALQVCEGQQIDMNFEAEASVTDEGYLNMIRLKTAVLLGFSLELGVILAGGTAQQQKQLYQVGENMGIGFQLMDDLLDVYGDHDKFGKQVGGDILSNKKTYLLIQAIKSANKDQRTVINYWLSQTHFLPEKKISAITTIYNDLNVRGLVTEKMNHYFDQAKEGMDGISGRSDGIRILKEFAMQLIKRES